MDRFEFFMAALILFGFGARMALIAESAERLA